MRSLPTMEVFQPADDIETLSIMRYLVQSKNPSYLRLTRQDLVRVHEENYRFTPGVFPLLKGGKDITVFASGGTVFNALNAARELSAKGIDVAVYNASSLKPIDEEAVMKAGQKSKLLVTVEDHSIIGGLGSAIAESLCVHAAMPALVRLGIRDEFGESGTPESLYEKHGLSKEGIARALLEEWRKLH